MQDYEVRVYREYVDVYRVDADSEEDAKKLAMQYIAVVQKEGPCLPGLDQSWLAKRVESIGEEFLGVSEITVNLWGED